MFSYIGRSTNQLIICKMCEFPGRVLLLETLLSGSERKVGSGHTPLMFNCHPIATTAAFVFQEEMGIFLFLFGFFSP